MAQSRLPEDAELWMGVLNVVAREGCEMLPPEKGAFVHVLTFALGAADYRAKVVATMKHYGLDVLGVENESCVHDVLIQSDEILPIISELEQHRDPKHVRIATLHTYPRVFSKAGALNTFRRASRTS